jgi:hypothetical protein
MFSTKGGVVIKKNIEVVVIPETTTIHIPIIAIGLIIMPSIYLLIIFIPEVFNKKNLMHFIQRILNTSKTIIEAICKVMQSIIQRVKQLDFECFNNLYNLFEGFRGAIHLSTL